MAKKTAIKTINKTTAKALKNEVMKALEAVEKKYNIDISSKAGTYTDTSLGFKIEIAVKNGKVAMTQQARDFVMMSKVIGIPKKYLGKSFTFKNKTYTITGYNMRKKKQPIDLKDKDGNGYSGSVAMVQKCLNIKPSKLQLDLANL